MCKCLYYIKGIFASSAIKFAAYLNLINEML